MSRALLGCVGDLLQDVVVSATAGPLQLGTDNQCVITRTPGGSAANVAALAGALGPARFIGRVGDDALGEVLVDGLAADGVDVRVQRQGRTGSIVVVVDHHGERTMFPDRAAGAELADVPVDWVGGVDLLHVPAYCFDLPHTEKVARELTAAVRDAGGRVAFDASSTDLLARLGRQDFLDAMVELAPDLLFANADEARYLRLGADTLPATTVVVKDGAGPVRIHRPGRAELRVHPAPVARVTDTTGAGDAFAAGYLRAVLDGHAAADAARAGSRLAATLLDSPGARPAARHGLPRTDRGGTTTRPAHQEET